MTISQLYSQIKKVFARIAQEQGFETKWSDIQLEHPANAEFGDLSTNIAMKVFPKSAKGAFSSPRALAQVIATQAEKQFVTLQLPIQSVEVAGAGFINLSIDPEFFIAQVHTIALTQQVALDRPLEKVRIMTEFTDPNPFKEFHIGHLYSNSVGESLSRLLESQGAQVKRVCYQGDVGMHVAKALWGMVSLLTQVSVDIPNPSHIKHTFAQLQEKYSSVPIDEKTKFLGKAYAHGATFFEESEQATQEMKVLNKMVFAREEVIVPMYDLARQWSLDYFEVIYRRLGTKFDSYYFESSVGKLGTQIVRDFLSKGVFLESQGAVIFPGSKHGLHDRVFLNSLGLPTYEAKELGLAPTKYQDWPYDRSFIITGNEIKEYFKVLLKAMELIYPEIRQKTTHLSHGMVRLPEGKMSSRKGNVLTGEWLIAEAKSKVLQIMAEGRASKPHDQQDQVAEVIAVGAVKFALLKNALGGDIAFSMDESVSFEGNSGPYIQYTYARCRSVLRKAEAEEFSMFNDQFSKEKITTTESELNVMRTLYQFDEVVQRAGSEYAPHHLCTFLFELAQSYNAMYNSLSILNADTVEQKAFRFQVTKSVSIVLKHGLHLLGISVVEEM